MLEVPIYLHNVFVKEGKYDANVSWPFLGKVTITLLNQLEDKNHHSVTIVMDATENMRPGKSLGYHDYISQSELDYDPEENTQYLKDDKLCFRVYFMST